MADGKTDYNALTRSPRDDSIKRQIQISRETPGPATGWDGLAQKFTSMLMPGVLHFGVSNRQRPTNGDPVCIYIYYSASSMQCKVSTESVK